MLKKILLGLVAIVALLAAVVAMQPAEFKVSRSIAIAAPPDKVFPLVNDFHNWEGWSPWAKLDPQAKNSFEGPEAGTGAVFKWSGNDEVGEGEMTILESIPFAAIKIRLEFIRPFPDTSTAEFFFKPLGEPAAKADGDKAPAADGQAEVTQTEVTWSIYGRKNFISKAVCMFMNMDKMLGGEFEKGLASMKAIAEAPPGEKPAAGEKPAT